MGASLVEGQLMLVSEYLPRGDLERLLHSDAELPLLTRLIMARDTALGMSWLHGHEFQIIHR